MGRGALARPLAFGYGANPGLSGEIEAGYRATQASGIENTEVNFPGSPTYALLQEIPVDADLNTLSLMANGYYTIDAKVFRPYVGAGIGLAQHKAKYPMLKPSNTRGDRPSVPGFFEGRCRIRLSVHAGFELGLRRQYRSPRGISVFRHYRREVRRCQRGIRESQHRCGPRHSIFEGLNRSAPPTEWLGRGTRSIPQLFNAYA